MDVAFPEPFRSSCAQLLTHIACTISARSACTSWECSACPADLQHAVRDLVGAQVHLAAEAQHDARRPQRCRQGLCLLPPARRAAARATQSHSIIRVGL